LAILAQRPGRVFAAPATWYKLVRERGWRRPRMRVHPRRAKEGVRATEPDELWHIDTAVIRLIDGSKVYLHALLDNCSRKILAWRISERFEVATSVAILEEAARGAVSAKEPPTLVTDGGVENVNGGVDELVALHLLRRVVALKDVTFSNSTVEAWWRALKHQWLDLNTLDSCVAVRRLVAFYVASHNSDIPHSAFRGQTPDEMYCGRGGEIPERVEAARQQARSMRAQANRKVSCQQCQSLTATFMELPAAAQLNRGATLGRLGRGRRRRLRGRETCCRPGSAPIDPRYRRDVRMPSEQAGSREDERAFAVENSTGFLQLRRRNTCVGFATRAARCIDGQTGLDQARNPRQRPQLGGKSVRHRAFFQRSRELGSLQRI
jgi:hypothetical protein